MKTSIILAASTALLPLSAIAAETISCDTLPTCAELGYTEAVAQCPGKYLVCPFDRTLGTCIHDAKVGQIGYFTKDPGNGWLLCDGKIYNAKKYPDLAAALASKYVLSSTRIQVPDYRGDFLRVYGGNSGSANTRLAEDLPNITGYFWARGPEYQHSSGTGAFYLSSTTDRYGSGHANAGISAGINFNASRSSSIYGRSSYVTPINTAVYAYIYAGKVDSSAGSPTFPTCSENQYYYADGTCSSSYSRSKTLRGIVTSTNSSKRYISYITGGTNSTRTKNGHIAKESCEANNGSFASYLLWLDLRSKNISNSVVRSPLAASYYWGDPNQQLFYCSSASSCSTKIETVDNYVAKYDAYYYCSYTDYYAE